MISVCHFCSPSSRQCIGVGEKYQTNIWSYDSNCTITCEIETLYCLAGVILAAAWCPDGFRRFSIKTAIRVRSPRCLYLDIYGICVVDIPNAEYFCRKPLRKILHAILSPIGWRCIIDRGGFDWNFINIEVYMVFEFGSICWNAQHYNYPWIIFLLKGEVFSARTFKNAMNYCGTFSWSIAEKLPCLP